MKVVNIKNERCEIYIGRGSIFGNKFIIGRDGNRDEVIEKYKVWLWKKVREDKVFLNKVLELKDSKSLGCFCFPLECHGDVLVSFINWYLKKGGK